MPVHSYSGSTPVKNTGCYPPADGLSSAETLHCSQRSSIVFYWYVETSTVMLKSVFRHLILIILAFALVSCTSLPSIATQKRSISLDASLSIYRKMIRWGYYDEAAKYLRASDGSLASPDLDRIALYRVTNYNMGDQLIADNGKEARVIAMIEYYELDSGVIHTLRDEQYWWYDEDEKRWYLGSPLPGFGLE